VAGEDHIRTNRRLWERVSDAYERRHERTLKGHHAEAWGLWRVPEASLQVLGPVRGKDVLELGCGAARWSLSLERRGARVVGLDLSKRHLAHARREAARAHSALPLVRANAEIVPFRDASFDVIFCDWGAMSFCDPFRTVPEAARLLRPSGILAFATLSPWRAVSQDRRTDRIGTRLRYAYFDLHRVPYPDEVDFTLPYGEWIQLFRAHGFEVEGLHETRPGPQAASSYLGRAEQLWARRWPLEMLWRVRKSAGPSARPLHRGRRAG
jgi:SAM-dependent methyltransferase